jgi:sphinganine-1-phosphate aldolase
MYVTPTILGSKSGALIATTWASLLRTGVNKYARMAKEIKTHVFKIREKFENNPDITIVGEPWVNIIAFSSKTIDIYRVVAEMKEWNLSVLTNPPAFHFCITSVHTNASINKFNHDLETAIIMIKAHPDKKLDGTLAIYGSATKIENSLFTDDVLSEYVGLLSKKRLK